MPDYPAANGTIPPVAAQRGAGTVHADGTPVRVLVVDDEPSLAELLSSVLRYEGWNVRTAGDGADAVRAGREFRPDAVVLDIMLPDFDGIEVMRRLRAELPDICVLFLTARDAVEDRVTGLTAGGDDYVTKPFSLEELLARIRAVLRRSSHPPAASEPPPESHCYGFDRWVLNTETRELLREDGVTVPLSTGEYELLVALVERPQRVLSRDQLLDLARGRAAAAFDRSIDTQVSRLRKKLERDPADPHLIKTIWGGGYMFAASVTRT